MATKTEEFFKNINTNSNTTNTDSYSGNESYDSFFDRLEAARKKIEEEERAREAKRRAEILAAQQKVADKARQQAKVDYYNENKETMVQNRTNSLIYDYDLQKAGGRNYDYNGAVDTTTADLKTKLGLTDLSLDNFLVKKQDEENKKKLEEFNKKQEMFSNPTNNILNTPFENQFKLSNQPVLNNPYTDDIKTFNEAINDGEIRKAQNAMQRINSRYFGADYADGVWSAIGDMMFGTKDKDRNTLVERFKTNATKLTTINDTISKTTDEKTLLKLQEQKSQLEFENQLIQYNRLTYLEAELLTINDIEQHQKNMEQPFESAANIEIDDTNLFTKVTSSLNKGLQYIGAGANFITEGTFGSINLLVQDDQDEGFIREATAVVADTATYLIPYVGQVRFGLTVAKDVSIIAPGVGNMLGGDYQSAVLGKNPDAMNTVGAAIDIAAVYASNKIFGRIKANLGLEGQSQFYQYSGKEIAKLLMLDVGSETGEEFFQTYADQMMYNENFGMNDFLDKKYFVQAILNAGTAAVLTLGLSSVGSYSNNVTSDNILIRTDDTKTIKGLLTSDNNAKNSKIDTPKNLYDSIYNNLNNDKIVTVIDPNALDYDKVEVQNLSNIVSYDSMVNNGNDILQNLTNTGINIKNLSDKDSKIVSELNDNIKTILNNVKTQENYNTVINLINDLSNASSSKQAISIYDSYNLESPGLTLENIKSLYNGISTLNRSLSTSIADVSISNLTASNNVRSIIVPSTEMETYIKSINPNIDTVVINPKDPDFGNNLQNYLDGQSKFGIKPRKTSTKNLVKQSFNTKTATDINDLVTDIQNDLEVKEAMKDIVVDFNVNNSLLNDTSIDSFKANVKSQMIDALPKNLSAKQMQKQYKKFSDNLEQLMPTDRKSQVYLSDANGKNIVFEKTGSNTYETSNRVDSEGKLLANVRSNGNVLNGNLTSDARFSKKEINAVNKLMNKLKLEGDLLNEKSSAKDVLKLISKNNSFSKEILQALGYDGIISGKKKLKYTSAHDDADNINMSMASDVLTIKAKDLIDNHKDSKAYVPKTKEIKPETMSESIDNDNKTINKDSFISDSKDSEYFSPDVVQEFRNINITDKKAKKKVNGVFDYFYAAMVDKYHPIVKDAKSVGDVDVQNAISNLYTLENRHYNNANISQTNYNNEPIGKSIKEIFSTIKGKENKDLFDKTMRLLLNAERIDNGMEPIFPNISAEKSRYSAEKVLAKHPEFKIAVEDLRTYNNNSLDTLVEAGLINNNLAKSLKEKYKYYVPIYTANPVDYTEIGSDSWFKAIQANDTIQDVTKAGKNFISIEESMRRKDYQQMKAILTNDVMKTIANSKAGIVDKEESIDLETTIFKDSKVRDEDGKLKVVYHGTNSEFDSFDETKSTNFLNKHVGFFFTDNENVANTYSTDTNKNKKVYLDMKNPLIVDAEGRGYEQSLKRTEQQRQERINDVKKEYKKLTQEEREFVSGYMYGISMKYNTVEEYRQKLKEEYGEKRAKEIDTSISKIFGNGIMNIYDGIDRDINQLIELGDTEYDLVNINYMTTNEVADKAKEQGYDGVIFKNIIDIASTDEALLQKEMQDKYLATEYVVFKNNQIKDSNTKDIKKDNSKNIYSGKSGEFTYFDKGELKKFGTHKSYAQALGTQRVELIDKFFSLPIINSLPKIQKIKQKLITTYDPIFQLNNIVRDFQDTALYNTKYPTKFAKNYVRAIYNMSAKTELFEQFKKIGIITYDSKNKLLNITSKMEALPKFAEYISALDSGKTATEAKIESQGANLNFARRGWLGGQLNDKGFLFLNAAIQGADKAITTTVGLVRGANTPAGFGRLVLTLGAAAAPGVINALLNEDDEDYAKLPYYYKNNYYFIKTGDGTFIRIPKGRVTALVDTITRYATGISKESSAGNYFESLQSAADSAILPPELSDAAPWSLLTQISENRNFFGGEIYGPQDPAGVKAEKIAEHVMTDFFGRYGKSVKALTDEDSTTDLLSQSSFFFNSTKYNKDIGTIYELNDYYNGLDKKTMDFETRIEKKYINTKLSALNSIRGEINDMKETDTSIGDMRPTYQLSDALVKDILANYKNYHTEDDGDTITIYFDDETFIYNKSKDEFRKVK